MAILSEREVRLNPGVLTQAWEESPTFAFVADQHDVSSGWLTQCLDSLPPPLRTGHFCLMTSGSTGRPKLLVASRERAERLARLLYAEQQGARTRAVICALPLNYCYAFVNQWVWARISGSPLHLTDGLAAPDALGEALRTIDDSQLCLVGPQVALLLRAFGTEAFPKVATLCFAGSPFPYYRRADIGRMFPNARIYTNYGCAEAMPRLTVTEVTDIVHGRQEPHDPGYIGTPLPGIELATDEDGQLRFRSPYGAVGALQPDGFSAIGPDTWVTIGDMAEQLPDGHWRLVGRQSEVFKRYGEKVSLPRLGVTVGGAWPGAFAFVPEVDPNGEPGCVLVLAPEADDGAVRAILRALRENHPRAYWPLRIETTAELPLLANDKVDVQTLAHQDGRTIAWRQRF